MSRPKRLIDPVHLSTVIERKTYQGLIAMTNSQAIQDEKLVSLAEFVRNLLRDAVIYGAPSASSPDINGNTDKGIK